MSKIYIGTSGWVYKAWHDKFYPPELKREYLQYYSKYFNTVEINNTFYRLPKLEVFQKWKHEVPAGFKFAVKMSRVITHVKRLREVEIYVRNFLLNSSELGNRLGPILIQLPPSLKYDDTIAKFFELLRDSEIALALKPRQYALEPRHLSWFIESNLSEIRNLVKKYKVGLVIGDSGKFPEFDPDEEIVGKIVYVRLHGPEEFAASQYAEKLLKPWAQRIKKWQKNKKTVYIYFNNDVHGYAILDAKILNRLAGA